MVGRRTPQTLADSTAGAFVSLGGQCSGFASTSFLCVRPRRPQGQAIKPGLQDMSWNPEKPVGTFAFLGNGAEAQTLLTGEQASLLTQTDVN